MFNPFSQPSLIKAEVFASLPDKYRNLGTTDWSNPNRQGAKVEQFLEGPSFDRNGNLYVTDIPYGRIFKIDPSGNWDLVCEYDGWPNGLKFHKDGRAFIACYKQGLMVLDVNTGKIEPVIETMYSEGFKGLNDLHFNSDGDLFFTDQGQTGIIDWSGRVFKYSKDGELQRLVTNAPSPNGITLNNAENQIYVAVTRSQQIWRLPLMKDKSISKSGVAIQLSGGHAGPDGIEIDSEDGIIVCHLGVGVWRFDNNCLPTHLVYTDEHSLMTNIAFGGPERKTLYITDSMNGRIMRAEMPVAGKVLYGLS